MSLSVLCAIMFCLPNVVICLLFVYVDAMCMIERGSVNVGGWNECLFMLRVERNCVELSRNLT